MAIRFATARDIPALVALGKRQHAMTRFHRYPYRVERVAKALHDAIERAAGRYVCLVAQDSTREVVGVLLAVLERQIFSELLPASVMHCDVLPEKRMGGYGVHLLNAFEQWAANRKVAEIAFGINSESEMKSVGRFAVKMGFSKLGENFVKAVAG